MGVTILRVRDVGASVDWYRTRLGVEPLHVGADGPDHPIATYHLGGVFFTLWQLPPGVERQDRADTTSYEVFLLDDDVDLEARRSLLADAGVRVDEAVRSSDNNRFIQFYDTDGNRWELAQPMRANPRQADEDVTTP